MMSVFYDFYIYSIKKKKKKKHLPMFEENLSKQLINPRWGSDNTF